MIAINMLYSTCVFQKSTNFKSSQQYRTARTDLSTSNSRELVKPFARYAYELAVHNSKFTAFRLSDDDTGGGILAKHINIPPITMITLRIQAFPIEGQIYRDM